MSPTAVNDVINASVKDNTGATITSGVSYSWKIDSAEVGTESSYTVKADDAGKTITLTVTVGEATATATATVAAAEEEAGPFSFKLNADAPAKTYAAVSNVKQGKDADNLSGVAYAPNVSKAGALTKDNMLTFKVATLKGFTNTVTVKMGGETVTPTAKAGTNVTTYTVAKVTGDVEISISTVKATEYTLTISGNKLAELNGGEPYTTVDIGAGSETPTKTSPLTFKIPAGATVVVKEGNSPSNLTTSGNYNLTDDLTGTVDGSASTLTFTMPSENLTIDDDLFVAANINITVHVDSSLTVANAPANGVKKGGDYTSTDGKSLTFKITSPTGSYIIVNDEDAVSGGEPKTGAKTSGVSTGALTGEYWIKPAAVLTIQGGCATVTDSNKKTVATGYGVVPGTALTVAPVRTVCTNVIGETEKNITDNYSGGVLGLSGGAVTSLEMPNEDYRLVGAGKLTLKGDVTAKIGSKNLSDSALVSIGTNLVDVTGGSTATTVQVALKSAKSETVGRLAANGVEYAAAGSMAAAGVAVYPFVTLKCDASAVIGFAKIKMAAIGEDIDTDTNMTAAGGFKFADATDNLKDETVKAAVGTTVYLQSATADQNVEITAADNTGATVATKSEGAQASNKVFYSMVVPSAETVYVFEKTPITGATYKFSVNGETVEVAKVDGNIDTFAHLVTAIETAMNKKLTDPGTMVKIVEADAIVNETDTVDAKASNVTQAANDSYDRLLSVQVQ